MTEKLESCPWCGCTPNKQIHPDFGPRVFCDDGYEHFIAIGGKTMEEAIKAWNTRHQPEIIIDEDEHIKRTKPNRRTGGLGRC